MMWESFRYYLSTLGLKEETRQERGDGVGAGCYSRNEFNP